MEAGGMSNPRRFVGSPQCSSAIRNQSERRTCHATQRLKELGLELPPPPPAAGNYVAGVVTGNLLFMSGCGPRRPDGGYFKGKVGAELSIEQGYEAARQTGLNTLANIRAVLGSPRRQICGGDDGTAVADSGRSGNGAADQQRLKLGIDNRRQHTGGHIGDRESAY